VQQINVIFSTRWINILKNNVQLYQGVKRDISVHLRHFKTSFDDYFPPNNNASNWIRNPFIRSFQMGDFSINEYEQLIDIVSDLVLKQNSSTIPHWSFWASLTGEYPEILTRVVRKPLPSAYTYLCESTFSRENVTNTKDRSKLDAEADLRMQLLPIIPDLKFMCPSQQPKWSHWEITIQ
jgi:hypothetical protein